MSILETIIFFLVVWWPIFFMMLPFGFEPITKDDANTKFVKSAPNKPKLLYKFYITTSISLVLTIVAWMLVYFKIFSLKSLIL